MNKKFQEITCKAAGATDLFEIEVIQSLWSGYGKIVRYGLKGSDRKSVVVKHVKLPNQNHHPRGWNTDISHQRKIKSYQVETAWYEQWSQNCDDSCRIPHCLALESDGDEVLMVLEDLDESGYPIRKNSVSMSQLHSCLSWLANFHATFIGKKPTAL
ncbi:MAG: choline kinase, partial [Pseudomonadota bacterium]